MDRATPRGIGNSAQIADKHYLQVTDAHFADGMEIATCQPSGAKSGAQEAQNQAQHAHAENRGDSQSESKTNKKPQQNRGQMPIPAGIGETLPIGAIDVRVPPRGVEPLLPD